MFRGFGFGGVQISNFEHLRGAIYRKIQRMEGKSQKKTSVEVEWAGESGGREEIEDFDQRSANFLAV